jgi:5-methyltetrahydropteroyltriglutamate--homocysteine methyltransferase
MEHPMPHSLPRADQVGSHLRPTRLHEARARFKAGGITATELRAVEDACIRDLVRKQEEIGFDIVTDGEFRRENWWIDFIRDIGGVEIKPGTGASFTKAGDHDYKYVPLNVYTAAKITRPKPIATSDYAMLASATKRMGKITIPSPSRMHFHSGRAGVSTTAYPDIEEFFADVAALYRAEIADLEAAGCRLIQIDDPLLSYFISEHMQAEIIATGDKPAERLARYIALINDCIRDRRPDTTIGIHVCRGNSRSGWMAEGGYDRIAEAVFDQVPTDGDLGRPAPAHR